MGCGWLGKPLAASLITKGYSVKGTTTQISKLDDLRNAGIDPYVVELTETFIDGGIDEFLAGLDVLVVNIPPGLRSDPDSDFEGRIRLLVTEINAHKNIQQLLYISSIAVFEDADNIPTYNESKPANATDKKGKKLIAAEKVILKDFKNSTIIRPGGLIGDDRHPVKYLAGKKNISNPEAPVNLTDRNYLIDVIEKVIDSKIELSVVHAISEEHESKKSYYIKKAQEFDLELPVFDNNDSNGKRVISTIL